MENRRQALMMAFLAAGGGAAALAGCTQQQASTIQQDVANAITDVQAYVAAACNGVEKLIPTAQSVFAVLASLAGTSDVIAGIAAGGNIILTAAQAISNTVCSAVPPTPNPAPSTSLSRLTAAAPPSRAVVVVVGPSKNKVPVNFY